MHASAHGHARDHGRDREHARAQATAESLGRVSSWAENKSKLGDRKNQLVMIMIIHYH